MNRKNKITDYDIESVMGTLLITGVIISGAVVLFGGYVIYIKMVHRYRIIKPLGEPFPACVLLNRY